MASGERRRPNEPIDPAVLPPELAEFLRHADVACLMEATSQGTAFVIKLPDAEIVSVGGTIPIGLSHELYAHPNAPVIRTLLRIFDQPDSHLALETYTNVADNDQRANFAALGSQETLILLFYDEQLAHRLTKVVPQSDPKETERVLAYAERLLATIPQDYYNFDEAKETVIRITKL
jgi:hypothetical protein